MGLTPAHDERRGSVLFTAWLLILVALLILPVWVLIASAPAGRATRRVIRRCMRAALLLSGCPLRVSGLEHLGAAPCVVMVANHSSYLDVVVLLAAIPQDFRFVANHQAATRPLVGMVIRKQGHLVVDRGSALSRVESARAMSRMLAAGKSLLVFPEGTRSAGSLGKFTSGAFRAAMRSGRPIVPIAIAGTAQIFPRRTLLCRWSAITVMVLQPMAASTTGNGAELAGRAARNIAVALQ